MDLPCQRRQLLLAGAAALLLPRLASAQRVPNLDVPFVPTPPEVVEKMLDMAGVQPSDVVYDLGCGDGRIVIAAARKYGARGVGIDIDPRRITEARVNARNEGVASRVHFRVGDLFKSDFSRASVVTLYLLPQINQRLRPQLWRQLKVGTRVVSHEFDMGPEWPPEQTEMVGTRKIHFWTIKAEHKG